MKKLFLLLPLFFFSPKVISQEFIEGVYFGILKSCGEQYNQKYVFLNLSNNYNYSLRIVTSNIKETRNGKWLIKDSVLYLEESTDLNNYFLLCLEDTLPKRETNPCLISFKGISRKIEKSIFYYPTKLIENSNIGDGSIELKATPDSIRLINNGEYLTIRPTIKGFGSNLSIQLIHRNTEVPEIMKISNNDLWFSYYLCPLNSNSDLIQTRLTKIFD
ncbi:MAG: hypothetical protein U0T82_00150 [Bacteroidales bacterium]